MNTGPATANEFDLAGPLPVGRTVLEASAGTGKTYSITGLIVRYIAEGAVSPDQFLVVTFTRAAANELRNRTRTNLDSAAHVLRSGIVPDDAAWMATLLKTSNTPGRDPAGEVAERLRRVTDAISRFDDLTITTIHGFCQQSLAQLGVRSGNNPDAVLVDSINDVVAEVCRDIIVTALADDPTALNSPPSRSKITITNPAQAEGELIRAVGAMMNNPGARVVPEGSSEPMAHRWVELTVGARQAVVQRQAARGEIGYDTLISGLHDALTDPQHGATVAAQLGQRYAVVLVDEFQDTDRLQWDVFDRAFSSRTLITVGDPKQAIYRFRGADLDAVEARTAAADPALPQHVQKLGLTVNFRSDQVLLQGLGHLFAGATLGDPRIPFVPVHPRKGAPPTSLASTTLTTSPESIQLRVVPGDVSLRTKVRGDMAMPLVRSLVLADLVERVIDLLDNGHLLDDRIEPGDIAVLVPSHNEANNVAEALGRARIPAVRTRTGSVLKTPAATQWRLLLAALAQPHQVAVVRAAALGWFLTTDAAVLVADDTVLADLQSRAADLGDRLRTVGVSAFYDELKADATVHVGRDVVTTVLAQQGGERQLTDLDHISELLAAATQGRSSDPAQVVRQLDDLIADADDRNEAAMRRIDSDARAVQITTIHSAKGLEYPIVLVPFAFKPRPPQSTPVSFTGSDGRRTIDFASRVAWDDGPEVLGDETTRRNQDMRRFLGERDAEGDELRLLYVALTRAKHRLEIWWASIPQANGSALGRILLDRFVAADVQNTPSSLSPRARSEGFNVNKPAYTKLDEAKSTAQLHALAQHSEGSLATTVISANVPAATWSGRRSELVPELSLGSTRGRQPISNRSWQRWSFSRLGSVVESEAAAKHSTTLPTDDPASAADERGGFDEPAEDFDELPLADAPSDGTGQLSLAIGPVAHLADVVGGTRFGTFVHSVLEQLAFSSADLEGDIRALAIDCAAREGLELGTDLSLDSVTSGLVAAVRTPLGPLFGRRTLADITPADRLAELDFDMPIVAPAASSVTAGSMTAGSIGQILLARLPRGDALVPFATSLAGEFARFDIAGWMAGSIDGVFRVPFDGDHRYVIVDYKTNRLHQPGAADPVAAYHPKLLVPAMEHSRYPLQALLYTVALHRYLRWRLGGRYDPTRHLGGAAYLFVRGMVGPATPMVKGEPHGVFSWLPPVDAIVEIDRLFAIGDPA